MAETKRLTMKNKPFQKRFPLAWKKFGGGLVVLTGVFLISASLPLLEASSSHDIQIETQPPFFSPNQLTISLGARLTWKNRTQEPHTIISDDCRFGRKCSFDSGFLGPNGRFALPPLKPGRYPYHCGIHPFMRGLLTIHPPQSFSSSDI